MVASSTRAPDAMIPCTLPPSSDPDATARRSMSPVEIAGTPSCEASNAACVPCPARGGPRRTILGRPLFMPGPSPPASTATTADPALLHEAFVVAHHELAFDLLDRVHRDAHHD